ncbi:hypothetical protein F2Q68_00020718 [Brassica cretica]|uniref:Uncharacterized protein n=1 Tax=Brassica cretica TaxID=69181 RepID=A0A8S9FTJ2_BRACR|nr:hypothetical protein F2Q68_00020718 [Brassica cretica]
MDQYMEPAPHGDQDVLNNSTEVHPSNCTDQTDRAVYRIDPRTSGMELRLEPRPDNRTDHTRARLSRPSRHSKDNSRARLSLDREEPEDRHGFSPGRPSRQSRMSPYRYRHASIRWLTLDRGYIKSHYASLDDPFIPSQFQKCYFPSRIISNTQLKTLSWKYQQPSATVVRPFDPPFLVIAGLVRHIKQHLELGISTAFRNCCATLRSTISPYCWTCASYQAASGVGNINSLPQFLCDPSIHHFSSIRLRLYFKVRLSDLSLFRAYQFGIRATLAGLFSFHHFIFSSLHKFLLLFLVGSRGSGGRETLLTEEKPSLRTVKADPYKNLFIFVLFSFTHKRMFGFHKKSNQASKPQQDKQRNQRKRQNRLDDDEKRVRNGDRPFTKAKRSNCDMLDQNELQTYASLEKMLHKTIFPIQQLKKKGNTNTSSAPKQHNLKRDCRAVYRIDPRTSGMELRLEPRPDNRTDRTRARLSRPSRQSKDNSRARLCLGREEPEYIHGFSPGGPSGQSRRSPYRYRRASIRWLALDRGYIKSHSTSLDDSFIPSQFQKCHLPSRIIFYV